MATTAVELQGGRNITMDTWMLISAMSPAFHKANRHMFVNVEDVQVAMAMAYEIGFNITDVANIFDRIEGKFSLKTMAMNALIQANAHLIEIKILESTNEICKVYMRNKQNGMEYTSTYSMEDAQRAGLTMGSVTKIDKSTGQPVLREVMGNYEKQPKIMLQWRAIAQGARIVAPHLLCRVYVNVELDPDAVLDVPFDMPKEGSEGNGDNTDNAV